MHDKAQWEKLRSLPNVLYTDGNAFSLWQNGELVDSVVTLIGDIQSSGDKLVAPPRAARALREFPPLGTHFAMQRAGARAHLRTTLPVSAR